MFGRRRKAKRERAQTDIAREISAAIDVAEAAHRLGCKVVLHMERSPTTYMYKLALCVDEPVTVEEVRTGDRQNVRNMFEPMYEVWCGNMMDDNLRYAFAELQKVCKLTDDTRWIFNTLNRRVPST